MGRSVISFLGVPMNTIKSILKECHRFLNDRILPHHVRIALIGDADSGKTTLLRSIDDRKCGYPLDVAAFKRMDVGMSDQEDPVEIPYRVFGEHGSRVFKVKDYKGRYFLAPKFHEFILDNAEGAVVLIRGSQLLKNPQETKLLKTRYLDVCEDLHGIRAAVLLDVAPEEVVDESSKKVIRAFCEDFRKRIIRVGVPEIAIREFSFQKLATDDLSREQKGEVAKQAAAPFLWLSEQLDRSIWTWIRTLWWPWKVLVIAVVLAVVLIASVVLNRIPVTGPQPDTGSTIGENDKLAFNDLAEALTNNMELLSLIGKDDPDIVAFGNGLEIKSQSASQCREEIQKMCNLWRDAWEKHIPPSDEPAEIIKRAFAILNHPRANPQQKKKAEEKRQNALEKLLNQELGYFITKTREPAVLPNGLTQEMDTLKQYLLQNEVEEWQNAIASCRSKLIQDQIEEWRNNSLDARPLLWEYASFEKKHKDNPFLTDATDFVAHAVDSKLSELLTILEASLRNPSPERVKAGKKAFQDLGGLCNSIRGVMVQKSPFGTRWESQFADEFWNASSQKDGKDMEHLLEFEEVFGWWLTISMVKIHADKDEYWVSLKEKSNEGSKWIVPSPEGYVNKVVLKDSNVGNVYRLSGEKKVILHDDTPFAQYSFNMYVCRRGEIAEFQEVKNASVNGAELFFKDIDENGQCCRKMEVTHDKTKTKIECVIYGTESERLLPKLENIVNRGGAQ